MEGSRWRYLLERGVGGSLGWHRIVRRKVWGGRTSVGESGLYYIDFRMETGTLNTSIVHDASKRKSKNMIQSLEGSNKQLYL